MCSYFRDSFVHLQRFCDWLYKGEPSEFTNYKFIVHVTHVHVHVHVYVDRVGLVVTMGFYVYYGQFAKGLRKRLCIGNMHMALYLQLFLWLDEPIILYICTHVWMSAHEVCVRVCV